MCPPLTARRSLDIREFSVFWRDHNIKRTADNSRLATELWCDTKARLHDFIV
jgi:hypothetical protein